MTLSEEIEAAREFVANAAKWNDRGDPRAAKAGLCLAETALAQAAMLAAQPPPGSSVALLRKARQYAVKLVDRAPMESQSGGPDLLVLAESCLQMIDAASAALKRTAPAEGVDRQDGLEAAARRYREAERHPQLEGLADAMEALKLAALAAPQPLPSAQPDDLRFRVWVNGKDRRASLIELLGYAIEGLRKGHWHEYAEASSGAGAFAFHFPTEAGSPLNPGTTDGDFLLDPRAQITGYAEPLTSAKPQEVICDNLAHSPYENDEKPHRRTIDCFDPRPATAGHNPEGVEAREKALRAGRDFLSRADQMIREYETDLRTRGGTKGDRWVRRANKANALSALITRYLLDNPPPPEGETLPDWDGTRPMVQPESGKRVRAARLEARMSLRYAAAALHMTAVQLGGIERGVYECPDFARMLCFFAIKTQLSAENAARSAEGPPAPAAPHEGEM